MPPFEAVHACRRFPVYSLILRQLLYVYERTVYALWRKLVSASLELTSRQTSCSVKGGFIKKSWQIYVNSSSRRKQRSSDDLSKKGNGSLHANPPSVHRGNIAYKVFHT